jgi:type I restriction enzyme S subunit
MRYASSLGGLGLSFEVVSEDWKFKTLGELILTNKVDIQTGPFGTMLKASSYSTQGVPVIAVKDIGINKIIHGQSPLIDKIDSDRLSKYKLQKNDIVFGRKGAVDRRALITDKEQNWIQGSDCIRIRFLDSSINPVFASYFFGTRYYYNWIMSNAQGTTMPSLNQEILKRVNIPLPPIEEQDKVANLLRKIDDKIELNNAINKNLEEMAQALFKRWFVDFEFPNENGEPYKSSGGEFKESELGLIPKRWEISLLEEFCEISTEVVNPSSLLDEIFEHYSIPAFDDDKTPVFEPGSEIKSNKYKVSSNSILVSKLNPETKRVWRPYCLTEHAICSTEFINYIPKNPRLIAYCYSVLNSELFHQSLTSSTTGSTNSRQRAKPRATLNFKMAFGGIMITEYYNRTVNAIYMKVFDNILLNRQLANTRDTLLPKLMSGEIRVPLEHEYAHVADLPMVAETSVNYITNT